MQNNRRYDKCYVSSNYDYLSGRSISILSPYRGEPLAAVNMIKNIFEMAFDFSGIEFLVRIDNDQKDLYDFLSKNEEVNKYNVKIYSGDRYPYIHLYQYQNELLSFSSGNILFMYCDGSEMFDSGWDTHLYQYCDKLVIMRPDIYIKLFNGEIVPFPKANPYPIITRKVYDILGRYSPTTFSDYYIDRIAARSGIRIFNKMKILSFLNDPVNKNAIEHNDELNFCSKDLGSKDVCDEMESDINKIIDYCKLNNIHRKTLPDVQFGLLENDQHPYVELFGCLSDKKYSVEFVDKDKNMLIYSAQIFTSQYCACFPAKPLNLLVRVSSEENGVFYEKVISI